jgi:hypothetical protein
VDTQYAASGYIGDCLGVHVGAAPDACTPAGVGRSSQNAQGHCWAVTYAPSSPDAGPCGPAQGGLAAGVFWQYPANNWNSKPGYPIPPGATKVSFWARGAVGGEVIRFGVGEVPPSTAVDCTDSFYTPSRITLTATWTQYAIPLGSQAAVGGIVSAFDWVIASTDVNPAGVTFYIDDIEWQKL